MDQTHGIFEEIDAIISENEASDAKDDFEVATDEQKEEL